MLGTNLLTPTADTTGTVLGPLAGLPGVWVGAGFSVIPRLGQPGDRPLRLELHETRETLTFTHVRPNLDEQADSARPDDLVGLHYRQEMQDTVTGETLHVEPGMWFTVAPSARPADVDPTLVRLACVPQRDPVLSHGTARVRDGAPFIPTTDTTPLRSDTQQPEHDPRYLLPFTALQGMPAFLTAEDVRNPNRLLQSAISQQKIVRSTTLTVDTECTGASQENELRDFTSGPASGTPMSMRATMWIEEIARPFESGTFLQLQYSQRVVLRHNGIDWPHVCVATLHKL
jgi:hypothetical protein